MTRKTDEQPSEISARILYVSYFYPADGFSKRTQKVVRADLASTMAAVATAPAGLGADDAARLLAPPPVEDVQFYSALTPRDSLPLLAVSGVTGKAFWIGSLPQPPDEEEETDDESDGEESEEEHELDAEGAAVQVRTSHFSLVPSAHDPRTREKPAPTQISRPWPFFFPFFFDDTCARARRSPICSRFLHPTKK